LKLKGRDFFFCSPVFEMLVHFVTDEPTKIPAIRAILEPRYHIVPQLLGAGDPQSTANGVLMVDADLRKEGVAQALGVAAYHGIREVLAKTMEVDQVLVSAVQLPNLSLLGAGSAPGEPGGIVKLSAKLLSPRRNQ